MSRVQELTPKIDRDHSRWPDRHPRSKVRTCDLCGADARFYPAGNRCDAHSPAAVRTGGAS